jgi:hypothetical protein
MVQWFMEDGGEGIDLNEIALYRCSTTSTSYLSVHNILGDNALSVFFPI